VGPAVRHSSHHHQRQGTSVCILPVVGTLLPSQHLPCADHCLSPPGKRCCGALSPPTKRRPAGPRSADWHAHLPWVLLGIRSAWRGDTAFSPSEAVFEAQHVLPGQFLASPEPPSPSFLKELQETLNSRTPPWRITTTALVRSACQKNCSSPASSWFAATVRSRRCHQCTTAHTWFWRDQLSCPQLRCELSNSHVSDL
jgi:hypothetical protein